MSFVRKYWIYILLLFFIVANCFVWYAVVREKREAIVTIAFLNIGQGDAIFIESPTGTQILVDGGPSQAILSELRKVMPFYDRTIDALVVTNPDKDHIAGFINVLRGYDVANVIEPGTNNDSQIYAELEREIDNEQAKETLGKRGTVLDLGAGATLTILFPDRDVSAEKTNEGSIIARLTYGSTSVMFTGDAPNVSEEYVLALDGELGVRSDILKVGHHGSRTSASESFVAAVDPKWAVISAGYKNSYKHPHPETLELFNTLNITVLGTYERGTIIFTCTVRECNYKTEK